DTRPRARPTSNAPVSSRRMLDHAFSPANRERDPSALAVHGQLLAQRVFGDADADMVLEAIGDGDQEIVDALVVDQLREQGARFAAVILAQEFPHLLHGDLAAKIDDGVLEQVANQFPHEGPPRGRKWLVGELDPRASSSAS